MPEHPGGEDAVEEGLDEGGLEEVDAFLALETDAERLTERLLHRLQRAHGCDLDAGACLAGVAGEVERQILRRGDAGGAEQGAAEELPEALVLGVLRVVADGVGLVPKLLGTGGDAVALSRHRFAATPGPEGEGAVVREEDLALEFQVVPHLRAALKGGEVGIERLHLDDAALGLEL